MVACAVDVTCNVVTVNVALVDPAGTVTLLGTFATEVLLLARATAAPPLGAGPLSTTVPAEGYVAFTVDGDSVIDVGVTLMVSEADFLTPLYVAEIVTTVLAVTTLVEIVNFALFAPAETVTDEGTVATLVLLLLKVTTTPPAGAIPFSATVPVEFRLPPTLDGFSERLERLGGTTVRVAGTLTPL